MINLETNLLSAPLPILLIDTTDSIVALNKAAISWGFVVDQKIKTYLELHGKPFATELSAKRESKLRIFRFPSSEKHCHLTAQKNKDGILCWLHDVSPQLAIAERLRQAAMPSENQLRRINHLSSTALGYAELLDVIMSDLDSLSPEQMALVQHYQSEVRHSLQSIQKNTGSEKFRTQSVKSSVLVVESHAALNELITELLKGEGYKVASFLDGESAVQYLQVNHHKVKTAIVEEAPKGLDKTNLINVLSDVAPGLDVILLAANPASSPGRAIRKPLDFEQLLQMLED